MFASDSAQLVQDYPMLLLQQVAAVVELTLVIEEWTDEEAQRMHKPSLDLLLDHQLP